MPTDATKANDDSSSELFHRRRRRRSQQEHSSAFKEVRAIAPLVFFRIILAVAVLFLRSEAFHFRSSTSRQSKPTTASRNHNTIYFQSQSLNRINRFSTSRRTLDSSFVVARFAESNTKSTLKEASEMEVASNSTVSSSELPNLDESAVIGELGTNITTNETVNELIPYFASVDFNATTAASETIGEEERFGVVTRRDAFRYTAGLASALWVTGLTFTQTDPSLKKPPASKISPPPKASTTSPPPPASTISPPPRTSTTSPPPPVSTTSPPPRVSTTPPPAVSTPKIEPGSKLEPVNLTKVVSQTNVNVTMNCPKMCVSIDSSNFTFNKVERAKTPDWLPKFLAPKSQVVKKIPNSELLVAATVAGSLTEMFRTSLLYPLQTVKVRVQADKNIADQGTLESPSLSEQIKSLGSNVREKIDEGNLYAGISPTLLVSVPATGIYYGVRDVTKRLLYMTPLDSTWIAVGGALVGDVVSLCFRVPSDALAIRLQAQQQNATMGDWLGDSFRLLPMVILTDLPYLLSKIVLNKSLIQGDLSMSEYAILAAFASMVAGFLTTPFDVARTRILLNKWSDLPTEEIVDEKIFSMQAHHHDDGETLVGDSSENSESISKEATTPPEGAATGIATTTSNPGNSVIRTMIQITKEGDGGTENLFSGWLERVVYLGIGRAWLEPIQLIGYIGIRDAVLLEWF